jgi:hypothetical protein
VNQTNVENISGNLIDTVNINVAEDDDDDDGEDKLINPTNYADNAEIIDENS